MKLHRPKLSSTGMLAYLASIGRSIFHHHDEAGDTQSEDHWSVMHVDTDGVLQSTNLRIIEVLPGSRSVAAWSEFEGREIKLRVSKIVEAIDIRTGRRVNLPQWLEQHAPREITSALPRTDHPWRG